MLVPMAVGLAALPIIFRNAGQQNFTLFLLAYGAISFAPNLDLGVARTAQRRIAYSMSFHADTRSALLIHSLRRAVLISAMMMVLAALGALALFPSAGEGNARLSLAMVTGIGVGLAIYANCQRGILEGLGAFSRSALNRAGVGVMLVGAPVMVSFFTADATMLLLAALAVRIPFIWEQQRAIGNTLKQHTMVGDTRRQEDITTAFMQESGWFALLAILAIAMSGFDRYILIGWGDLAGEALAVFLATQDLALRAIAVPAALIPVLTVRLAAGDSGETARKLSRRLFRVVVPAVLLGCLGGTLLSTRTLQLLYPTFPSTTAAATLNILFLGIAASAIAQFPMARLAAGGRARDMALMHLAQFLVYLALVPVVIGRLGATGAALLWSGRIIMDAVMLVLWSGLSQGERSAMWREGATLLGSVGALTAIGFAA